MRKLRKSIVAIGLMAFLFGFSASNVARADDAPPSDPTLTASGGGNQGPVVASPEAWDLAANIIWSVFDCPDDEMVCYYALLWFNLLPPQY